MTGRRLVAARLAAVLVLVAAWQTVVWSGLLSRDLLPPPADVVVALVTTLGTGTTWSALLATLVGAAAGLGIAVMIGVPLGLVIGVRPGLDRCTRLLVDVGRSFPVVALLPVMILLLGASLRMKIVVVVLACVWPILVQALSGVRRMDRVVVDTVRSYGLPAHLRFRRVVLPTAGPYLATGLRIAAATAVLVSVGVEVLTQTSGLGYEINLAQQGGYPAGGLAVVLVAGAVGLAINTGLVALERRTLRWHAPHRTATVGRRV